MNKSPLKSITVQWYEGFQFRDTPFTVYTWKELDDFLLRVYDERVKEVGESNIHIGGYSKVKVRIEWKNGDYLEDRIDVGGSIGDYASRRDSPIGDYLKGPGVGGKPRSAMYGSSFQYDTDDGTTTGIVTETSRDDVSWTDYNKEGADDPKGYAFNELYAIVTIEYERWDDGETVDWGSVNDACSLMVSAIRRGQKE